MSTPKPLNSTQHGQIASPRSNYLKFALNMLVSLLAMYLVMFSMIDGTQDFRNNLNTFYMALTMVAPMGGLMLATMPGMFPDKRVNIALYAVLGVLLAVGLAGTRTQSAIGDRQFIASMIPHHSGAILMCREADLTDRQLLALCERITAGQREEIDEMKAIGARLRSQQ